MAQTLFRKAILMVLGQVEERQGPDLKTAASTNRNSFAFAGADAHEMPKVTLHSRESVAGYERQALQVLENAQNLVHRTKAAPSSRTMLFESEEAERS